MSGDTTDPRDPKKGAVESESLNETAGNGDTETDRGNAGTSGTSPVEDLQALATENADLRDRLLRTMAEMENLRRRTEREKTDTAKYAVSNFARDVLTVGDNLHRVIEHVPAEAAANDPALKSFLEGVELTERELTNMLERHGVKRIDPVGQRFDPNLHQAMYEVPNPQVPEGTVVDVMQAGYTIGDRCLRPALVAISKGGVKAAKPEAASEAPTPANDDRPGGDGGSGNGSGPES